MAVKKFKRDEIIKLIGVDLTDEQKSGIANEFEIEIDDPSFVEVQKKYKKEIDAIKERTIKARFKRDAKDEKDPKEPETFSKEDIEKLKKDIYSEAETSTRINLFLDTLAEEDREDANAIIKARINGGAKITDAIKSAKTRFAKGEAADTPDIEKTKTLNEFGLPIKKVNDKIDDELERELKKYI
jgi:membrane-associated HD superfamily phosphohydrolase